MLTIISNIAIIVVKFILFGIISVIISNMSFAGEYYALSFINIIYILRLTLLTSVKYNIFKIFSKKAKLTDLKDDFDKIFWLILIIFCIDAIILSNFANQVFLLKSYTDIINIYNLVIIESLFAASIIVVSYISVYLKNEKVAYLCERYAKIATTYSFPITFFIYISTISSKYYYVKLLKQFGTFIFLIAIIYIIIKYIISIKRCREKNRSKFGKENLIILVTSNNFEFGLVDHFKNPLNIFKRFSTTNNPKNLMIEGSQYTFISYDAVRYKLIDINKFKNVAYLFIVDREPYSSKQSTLEVFIQKIVEENQKFIVYEPKIFGVSLHSQIGKKVAEKYPYRYITKINTKEIIHIVNLSDKDDILKKNCYKLLNYVREKDKEMYLKNYPDVNIEKADSFETDKNRYIKYALNSIINSFNHVEYFYSLLKISEYVIHYIGLKVIIDSPEKVDKTDVKSGTLSSWRKCINSSNFNKEYSVKDSNENKIVETKDLILSIIEIRKILNLKTKGLNDIYYFVEDLSKIIADIRNNLTAHGTISYELAKNLIMPLFNIACTLVQEFEDLNITIREEDIIQEIFTNDITAIDKEKNEIYLYSNTVTEKDDNKEVDLYRERLNYETGKRKVIDSLITINIGKRLSDEAIKDKYKGGIDNINGTKKSKK